MSLLESLLLGCLVLSGLPTELGSNAGLYIHTRTVIQEALFCILQANLPGHPVVCPVLCYDIVW